MSRFALVLFIASFLVACQESEPTRPSEPGPVSSAISDGAHDGNAEVFFLPPLVKNPNQHPDYGDNPFNPYLAPFVRICELASSSCAAGDPIAELPMVLDLDKEQYRVNWETSEYTHVLELEQNHRIAVVLGDWVVGFRDVVPVLRRVRRMACKSEPLCRFNVGSVIPIKVRIEEFADCPDTEDCQTKSFNLADGTSFEVEGEAVEKYLLDIPPQTTQDDDVDASFGVCDEDQVALVESMIDLPTFGPCVWVDIHNTGEGAWQGELEEGATATVSFCELADPNFGLEDQGDHLRVHAFHDDGTVESLREKHLCNPVGRGGNSLRGVGTLFRLALGGKIDFYDTSDPRTAPAGSRLPTKAIVTDLEGVPVAGATVRWNIAQPPDEGAEVAGSVIPSSASCVADSEDDVVCTTPASGIVEVSWDLAEDAGVNKLTAHGHGIADPRDDQDLSCSIQGAPSRCNGPRENTEVVWYEYGSFDPFTPIAWEESDDDAIGSDEAEGADTIPDGTRLLFTAEGTTVPLPSGQIAFTRETDGNWDIWVMDGDGSNQFQVTFESVEEREPAWSPHEVPRIAFQRGTGAGAEIFVTSDFGNTLEQMTNNGSFDGFPAWSPDGSKIAFTSRRTGPYEIWVMNADGSNPVQLTFTGGYRPAWSPNGENIAFDSGRDGPFEIYVMDADGTNQTRLTYNSVGDFEPNWSPDGSKIAFHRDDGNIDIFVMDADGSNQTQVTQSTAVDADPAWTSDGSRIAFASNRSDHFDVFLIRPDGSNLVRLTTWEGVDRDPAWRWDQ